MQDRAQPGPTPRPLPAARLPAPLTSYLQTPCCAKLSPQISHRFTKRNLPITWKDSLLANFNPAHKAALDNLLLGDLPVFDESIHFIAAQQEESTA